MDYLIKSSKDCKEYIKANKVSLKDKDRLLKLSSEYASFYKLPNGEIVMTPNVSNEDYPGFIFKNIGVLNRMIQEDYFPIGPKYQTIWEIEKKNLEKIPCNIIIYEKYLNNYLNIEIKSKTLKELEKIYTNLIDFIRQGKNEEIIKEKLIISYGIFLSDYLIKRYKGKWLFETRFEVYNTYKYPLIEINNLKVDVISNIYSTLEYKNGHFQLLKELLEFE